ncbi:ABC transporter ATP-binding protein [Bacillus sp. TS-2]|nr:ABC transporter ATP-binding protein [Bacillus sp. TS-2]
MSELQSLRSDRSSKQQELRACTNEVAVLNNKIAKLDIIIEDFAQFKRDVQEHRNHFRQVSNETYDDWKGTLFIQSRTNMSSNIYMSSLREYVNKVDDHLDELNNERMRLQNEIYSTEGLMGNIKASINWLSTKITNLLN